jgi:hypothetical protein
MKRSTNESGEAFAAFATFWLFPKLAVVWRRDTSADPLGQTFFADTYLFFFEA